MTGRHQATAKKILLILPVQDDDFHYQILILAEEGFYFCRVAALFDRQILPFPTPVLDQVYRLVEAPQQGFLVLVELKLPRILIFPEGEGFLLHQNEDFAAKSEVLIQGGAQFGDDFHLTTDTTAFSVPSRRDGINWWRDTSVFSNHWRCSTRQRASSAMVVRFGVVFSGVRSPIRALIWP